MSWSSAHAYKLWPFASLIAAVPAGYYLKAPGQVAPCPKGEYKELEGLNGNCTKCAFGVTTKFEGSISQQNCTDVVAGRYATAITAPIVTATQICPQKYYCPGGTPYAAITSATDFANINNTLETTIYPCVSGLWTQELGSISSEQCCKWKASLLAAIVADSPSVHQPMLE